MRKPRRTQLDIIIEILKICHNKGVNKTRIVYSTNLNFKLTENYLKFLIEKGYINAGEGFQTSESGKEFLNKVKEIQTSLSISKEPIDIKNEDIKSEVA